MNDLIPKDEADLQQRTEFQIQYLQSLRKGISNKVKVDPEAVLTNLVAISGVDGMAQKMHLDKVQREARLTIIEIKRQMARQYSPGKGVQRKVTLESLDVARKTAERWRKMARLPERYYKRAVAGEHIPSEASIISEARRYLQIKKFLEEIECATLARSLDDFMKRGLSLYQVKEALGLIKEPEIELEDDDEVVIDIEPSAIDALEEFVQNGDRALQLVKDLRVIVKSEAVSKDMVMLVKKGVSKFIQAASQLKKIYQQIKEDLDDS